MNLFKSTKSLKYVYLQRNRLKRIESAHFCHLASLERVRLNENQLVHVGKDAFVDSLKLQERYLENNMLETPEK